LQDQHPNESPARYGRRKRAPERNDDIEEDGMREKDPAWIIVGRYFA
jgi:hypothetical protein